MQISRDAAAQLMASKLTAILLVLENETQLPERDILDALAEAVRCRQEVLSDRIGGREF